MMSTVESASILIVDDEESNVALLERMLRQAGYCNLTATTDSRQVLELFARSQPDIILLDLHMPHADGFETLDRLAPMIDEGIYLPILVLTADITQKARQRALSNGARDFVTKPFDVTEVLLRIRNLLETRSLHQGLAVRAQESSAEAQDAHLETLHRLAIAAEYRDDETGEHIRRVGRMSGAVAIELGLSPTPIERVSPEHEGFKVREPAGHIIRFLSNHVSGLPV